VTTEAQEHTHADGPLGGYAPPRERPPLASYAAFAALFNGAVAAGLLGARRAGHDLPERIEARDMVLAGVATHKLSRLLAKDKVTSFARAPFTELQEPGGPAELEEQARGSGLRRAVGELISCPYCLGLWVSAGFNLGLVTAPRTTRFVASIMTGLTISDFLQIGYKAAEDRGLGGG
jgi:hypothetical protein